MENRQAGADLVREGEEVEFDAELAVVPSLGLGVPFLVRLHGFRRFPGGAVDPLQLWVLLAAPPVGGGAAGEPERRDVAGGRHVRAAAQVAPHQIPGVRVQVVVDGQLAGADLDGLFAAHIRFQVDQLELVGLGSQLGARRFRRIDHPPGEPLAGLDDLAHPLLDVGQIVRGERPGNVEVVVEAVLDRRADAQLCVRELVLHRLGEHVRGRMTDDRAAVVGVRGDRLDVGVGLGGPAQVAQPAVCIPDHDNRLRTGARPPGLAHRRPGSRARRDPHARGGRGGGCAGHEWLLGC